jgi:hypothetical protein
MRRSCLRHVRMPYAMVTVGALAISGCASSDAMNPASVDAIAIVQPNARSFSMNIGEPVPLKVEARDAAGHSIEPNAPFAFIARDSSVASVSASGVIMGKRAGITYVVVQLSQGSRLFSDSIRVAVNPPV